MSNSPKEGCKQPKNIALVDCNNFYVSCERLFRPDLNNKPVAVLSNNDGCVVSRSQEVKDLGIKMAVPVYQIRHLVKKHNIVLFSSNYPLYADLSARVMHSLKAFSPSVDIYSIDEAFLDIDDASTNPVTLGIEIKENIFRWVGIPVGVGIGPTKTLAKLANYAAKKYPKTGGVVDLGNYQHRKRLMQITPVKEVWGIGPRLNEKLKQKGIQTVWELQSQSLMSIHKQFNITVANTVKELQGTPTRSFMEASKNKKQIICSRSFKNKVTTQSELQQSISVFCLNATEKLRRQNGVAHKVTVFIRTSPFDKSTFYKNANHKILKAGTQDSRHLLALSKQLLHEIFKPNYAYQQAGIVLSNIKAAHNNEKQIDIFQSITDETSTDKLMLEIDRINQRYPRKISFAATGKKALQQIIPTNTSGQYTTNWEQLASVL